jgi:hypothetical protein
MSLSLTLCLGPRPASGSTPAPTPSPVTTIYGPADTLGSLVPDGTVNGWAALMTTPADLSLAPISVSRQGFDAAGAVTSYSETLYTTKLLRQPYPNQATPIPTVVALSDYVYSTDTISGVTNSSAETSPKPVANWVMVDRVVVADALSLRIVAFHRNGIAAIIGRATDGTTTVYSSPISAVTATIDPLTSLCIAEYIIPIDITSLSDNANITANAAIYPRIGSSASGSVADSADKSNRWEFSPRTFRKNTARVSAPPLVYVASGGNDTTGYVGTDATLAAASPCATPTGAINRARTVLGTGAGSLDGLRVRLTAGTWSRSASPTANTTNAAIVIEPAPGVSKASCIFEFGAANNTFNVIYVVHLGLTIRRQGANGLNNGTGVYCVVQDCDFDLNTFATAIGANANAHFHLINTTVIGQGASGGVFNASANQLTFLRGCVFGEANSTAPLETRNVIGCTILGNRSAGRADISGSIVAFNKFLQAGSASGFINLDNTTVNSEIAGLAIVGNLVEWTSISSQPELRISSDGGLGDTRHVILWHNTFTGFNDVGRANLLYDETTSDTRTHRLQSFVGNIHVQINTKSDVFKTDGTRTGNWAYSHGVGVRGELSRYRDAAAGSAGFRQDYPGIGSVIGTINTGAGLDPLFTNYQATTSGPVAGAGGGAYTVGALSPAKALVVDSPLAFDLAGSTRSGTVAAGAFV